MPPEFGVNADIALALTEGALDALNGGDVDHHNALIAAQAKMLSEQGCIRIARTQFSMARARVSCEQTTRLPLLTTVDSALHALQRRLR